MSQVKFHTVDQPDSDTTTFVLSCNRLDVLAKTLQSFFDTQDYVTKMVIVDDSAEPGVVWCGCRQTSVNVAHGARCLAKCWPALLHGHLGQHCCIDVAQLQVGACREV